MPENLYAWVNLMPGSTPSLHVTGTLLVPTPCHEIVMSHLPEDPTRPEVYRIMLEERSSGAPCPQVVTSQSFHYTERNYAGQHAVVEVNVASSAATTVRIDRVS